MLRLLGFIIRVLLFSLTVLVLSNWVHWRGRTISDQVRLQLSHAERSPWVGKLPSEVRDWVEKATGGAAPSGRAHRSDASFSSGSSGNGEMKNAALRPRAALASEDGSASRRGTHAESIPASERQKLKALIRELNGPQGRE